MSAPNIGDGRLLRVCDLCGGVDDHPRHVLAGGVGGEPFPPIPDEIVARVLREAPAEQLPRLIRDLLDRGSSDRHMDCCRAAGCPKAGEPGDCAAVTAGAEELRGAELLEHLIATTPASDATAAEGQ